MEPFHADFISIRRALKVCSFAFLLLTTFQMPMIFVSVDHTGGIFRDMMGSALQPSVFAIARMLSNNIMFFALADLIILGVALVVTIKSKGGTFLYVNIGLSVMAWMTSLYFLLSARQLLQLPLQKFSQ